MSDAETHPRIDPIVEEVRAARDAIAAKHGYDVEKISAAFAERSKASGGRTNPFRNDKGVSRPLIPGSLRFC